MPVATSVFLLIEPLWRIFTTITLCVIPLWWLVGRLRIDPLAKLLALVICNLTLLYLLEFGGHVISCPPWITTGLYFISFIFSLVTLFRHRKSGDSFSWDGVLAWFGLAVWITGLQSLVVVYGAPNFYGDWYEHYERSVWFLDRLSWDQKFLQGIWPLSTRGPLFNAACGFFMSSARDFGSYQVFAAVLNTFTVLPLALLFRDVAGHKQPVALLWSMLICGIAPFAVLHETYTWTKFFTTGFVLSGFYFYRRGLTDNRPDIVVLSFGTFASGILAHYLVLLFVPFFGVHFFFTYLKRRWEPRVLVSACLVSFLLLCSWFGIIFRIFGIKGTFQSTSTFGDYVKGQAFEGKVPPWSIVFVGNTVTTMIPYSWRHNWTNTWKGIGSAPRILQRDVRITPPQYVPRTEEQDHQAEWFSDLIVNTSSLPGCIGWAGGLGVLAACVLSIKARRQKDQTEGSPFRQPPGRLFYALWFLLGIPLNILASRNYTSSGVAHLNLQPYVCLVAVLLLSWLRRLPSALIIAFSLLFIVESTLVTSSWIHLQQRKLPVQVQPDGSVLFLGKINADSRYLRNYIYKLTEKPVFLSDRMQSLNKPFYFMTVLVSFAVSTWIFFRGRRSSLTRQVYLMNEAPP